MPSRSDKPSGNTRRGAERRKTTRLSLPSSKEGQPQPPTSRPSSPKNTKPSFDAPRDAGTDTRTGWVYRSDLEPVPVEPVPVELVQVESVLVEPVPVEVVSLETVSLETIPIEPVEVGPVAVEPVAIESVPIQRIRSEFVRSESARNEFIRTEPSVVVPAVTPRRVEERPNPPPAATERPWVERSLYVMGVPVAVTAAMMLAPAMMMLAPAIWMFGSRSR